MIVQSYGQGKSGVINTNIRLKTITRCLSNYQVVKKAKTPIVS